jgi:glycosyltransferase involved in cell wall biosynthesis
MISGRDIVYISSIEWSFLWQGHQEIARRLAEAGNRILYVENTGVRAPSLRDAGRVALRLRRWAAAARSEGVREVAPNIYVCSPLVMPPFGPRWRRQLNRRLFLPVIRRAARRLGMRDPLFWTYLPTDTTLDLISLMRGPRSGVVYYCVADFSQLTPHAERLRRSERETVEASDVVFTNCSALARQFEPWNRHVHVFPFGVNLEKFPLDLGDEKNAAPARLQGAANGRVEAAEGVRRPVGAGGDAATLDTLPGPVIGYVGGMHRHVDFGMLEEMARARPDWSWVCVGVLQTDVRELASLPNVHLLGQRPHGELSEYVRRFDVCIVPYVNSVYTETVVPTKINEYLAVGKPVVSTDLPPIREFNEEHRVLLTTQARADLFLHSIERALAQPKDRATLLKRRRVAELAEWGGRLEAMTDLFERRLAEESGRGKEIATEGRARAGRGRRGAGVSR